MAQKSLATKMFELIDEHRAEWKVSTANSRPTAQRWRLFLPTPGNVLFTLLIVGTLLWAQNAGALSLFAAPNTAALSTGTIAYQGRLADSGGNPLTDTVNMSFRLYSAATAGTPLWEEQWTGTNSVRVSDGLFNVMLGSVTPIDQAVITGNSNLYLGITVGTDGEMTPRVQLGSVPFATQALTVPDGSITADKLAEGAVSQKLGEQPYYFSAAFATPSEWVADVIYNENYSRFCEAINRTFVRAETLQNHYHFERGNGYFYKDWYYTGRRYHADDTSVYGNGDPENLYNVWKYSGNGGFAITGYGWTREASALIWCK